MRRALVIVAVLAGMTATASAAATPRAAQTSLAGKWRGVLTGTVNGATRHEPVTFTINSSQTAGTWKVNSSCQGKLTLDSISNGYHHYRRHIAAGSTCKAGDIDCLQREGANVEDSVTPRSGGWGRSGTLHRLSTA